MEAAFASSNNACEVAEALRQLISHNILMALLHTSLHFCPTPPHIKTTLLAVMQAPTAVGGVNGGYGGEGIGGAGRGGGDGGALGGGKGGECGEGLGGFKGGGCGGGIGGGKVGEKCGGGIEGGTGRGGLGGGKGGRGGGDEITPRRCRPAVFFTEVNDDSE